MDLPDAAAQLGGSWLSRLPDWLVNLLTVALVAPFALIGGGFGAAFLTRHVRSLVRSLGTALKDDDTRQQLADALSPALELALERAIADHLKPVVEAATQLDRRVARIEGRLNLPEGNAGVGQTR